MLNTLVCVVALVARSPAAARPLRAHVPLVASPRAAAAAAAVQMGFLDDIKRTFDEARTMATAQHVLVDTEDKANEVIAEIAGGLDFGEAAAKYSSCPSSKKPAPEQGTIGPFGKGQMVAEFEQCCFREEIGPVHGPVKTQFGYHVIKIIRRKQV